MKVTQKQIARKLGVSQSTVSVVLSGRRDIDIPESTRGRVLKAVTKLNYRYPRSSSFRKTGNLGFLLPPWKNVRDQFYHRFLVGVQREAKESGRHVIVTTFEESTQVPDIVQLGKVDGLIVVSMVDRRWLEQTKARTPVVLLNACTEDGAVDSVMPDNEGGVRQIVDHLYSLGHRRIAFFAVGPVRYHFLERFEGYAEGLKEHGLKCPPDYIRMPKTVLDNMEELEGFVRESLDFWLSLDRPPTAVVTANDLYGLSVLKVAGQLGVRVPEVLSVSGFDNTIDCRRVHPTLTSVNQPMEQMGAEAVRLLLYRITETGGRPFKCIRYQTELVIGRSTGKAEPAGRKP